MTTTDTAEVTAIAALRVDVDATVTVLTDHHDHTLSTGVGDYPDAVVEDGPYAIWVNEAAKTLGLPQNLVGEGLWYLLDTHGRVATGDWIAGPCIITGPLSADGEPTPVSDEVASLVRSMAAAVQRHQSGAR